MFLYKYRPIDEWTLKSLSEETIHFKSPNYYNDPFDSQAGLYFDGSDEQWTGLKSQVNANHVDMTDFKKEFPTQKLLDQTDSNFSENMRISCFSENCNNILMWSHYADCHKGICLGFKTNTSIIEGLPTLLLNDEDFNTGVTDMATNVSLLCEVEYSIQKPQSSNFFGDTKDLLKIFLTKSLDWGYENEWRMITSTSNLRNDNPRYENDQLQEIIFGLRCPKSDIEHVTKIAGNQNIKFYQAKASKTEFKVDILLM